MALFPFNTNWAMEAQTDVPGSRNDLLSVVHCDLGSPALDDDDWFVTSANMKVGAYTLAHAAPDVARNVTVTATAAGNADTMGTILVTGTDKAGNALTETITPVAGTTVAGTKAFATVTSIVGAGWVIDQGNDTIKVGFGGLVGLPDKLINNTVLLSVLNGTRESTAAAVTFSATELALNTVDFDSAWGGTAASVFYIV